MLNKNYTEAAALINYAVVTSNFPIVFFSYVPYMKKIIYNGAICIATKLGLAALDNPPEIVMQRLRNAEPILFVALDAYDRPIFAQFFGVYTRPFIKNGTITYDQLDSFIKQLQKQDDLTIYSNLNSQRDSLAIFVERMIAGRQYQNKSCVHVPLNFKCTRYFENHYRQPLSDLTSFLNQGIEGVDAIGIVSLLHEVGMVKYEALFNKTPFPGRSLITAACLLEKGLPQSIALAANSVFMRSFSDVFALLTYASTKGTETTLPLIDQVILVKASKNEFGIFSGEIRSRDTKDSLYCLRDALISLNTPIEENDIVSASLHIALIGLEEWLCRNGVSINKARARMLFIESFISSLRILRTNKVQ